MDFFKLLKKFNRTIVFCLTKLGCVIMNDRLSSVSLSRALLSSVGFSRDHINTRMHSSRMRTARFSPHGWGGGGGSLSRGSGSLSGRSSGQRPLPLVNRMTDTYL